MGRFRGEICPQFALPGRCTSKQLKSRLHFPTDIPNGVFYLYQKGANAPAGKPSCADFWKSSKSSSYPSAGNLLTQNQTFTGDNYGKWMQVHKQTIRPAKYIPCNSQSSHKIFVWGFFPTAYVLSRRDPASRYSYCTFMTGLIPWVNNVPDVDTDRWIVPGTKETLIKDLQKNKPIFIVDTSPGNYLWFRKYPIGKFLNLNRFVKSYYLLDKKVTDEKGKVHFRVYRLKSARKG